MQSTNITLFVFASVAECVGGPGRK